MGPKSSSRDVAIGLGLSDRRIRQIARELGIEKEGRDWRFNATQVFRIRKAHSKLQVGRPAKKKTLDAA